MNTNTERGTPERRKPMSETSKTGLPCKCCKGSGTQINKDALIVLCPCCGGTGNDSTKVTF